MLFLALPGVWAFEMVIRIASDWREEVQAILAGQLIPIPFITW